MLTQKNKFKHSSTNWICFEIEIIFLIKFASVVLLVQYEYKVIIIIRNTIARSAVKLQKYHISCLDINNDLNTFLMTKKKCREQKTNVCFWSFFNFFPWHAGAIFDWSDVYAETGFRYAMNKILRQKKNHFNFSTIIEDVSINDSFQLVQKSKPIFVNNLEHSNLLVYFLYYWYTVAMLVVSNPFNHLFSLSLL